MFLTSTGPWCAKNSRAVKNIVAPYLRCCQLRLQKDFDAILTKVLK